MTAAGILLPAIDEVLDADVRVRPHAVRTPLLSVPFNDREVLLKAECLQPTGSFKIRGASMAMAAIQDVRSPVTTASAGNMGRAVAFLARATGRLCTVIVPDHAPAAKTDPMRELGANVIRVPFEEWWQAVATGSHGAVVGEFIHPFASRAVLAGNSTIALELQEVKGLDAVLVPWGGGGLAVGIVRGLRAIGSTAKVIAVEVASAAPLSAAIKSGHPVSIEQQTSFIDGMGASTVSEQMWPFVASHIDSVVTVSVGEVAATMRTIARETRLVVEGAGAAALAAASLPQFEGLRMVAIASGGNIDLPKFAEIINP